MKTKAIHICAKTNTVREIIIDGLDDMQRAVEGLIELVHAGRTDTGEPVDLYVNEEFLQSGFDYGFILKQDDKLRPFLGNGLVTGNDPKTGNRKDAPVTVEQVKARIIWLKEISGVEASVMLRSN